MEPNTPTSIRSNPPQPMTPSPASSPPSSPPSAPQQPAALTPDMMPEDSGSSLKKKILSIIIGLIVVGGVIALVFMFIVPRFFPSKPGAAELTYWGLWEDPAVMNEIIADFNREYPQIKVKYERQDIRGLGKYIDRLTTRIQNGTGPDIYRYHSSWPIELKGYLLPLPATTVNALQLDSQYYNVVKKDIKINGAYYGVPLQIDTLALFINDDLFKAADIKAAPTTWNELTDMAATLTVPDEQGNIKTAGVALGTFDNIVHASDIISLLFVQNRADLYNLAGPTKQNAIDALGVYYTYFAKGDEEGRGKTWDANLENSKVAFANGSLAMYFGYSWDVLDISGRNPELNYSVHPVPQLPPDRKETIASYWVEGVSSKTKHSKEAFLFLQFLGKRETLEKLYALESKQRMFGELYPRRDMKSLLSKNPLIAPFLNQADDAVSTPFSSDTYDDAMNAALNTYLGNAVNSILNNSSSPESAIDTLGAGETQVLDKYKLATQK